MEGETKMKMNIQIDMTPDEARKVMGLPDISKMQEQIVKEMQKRMMAAIEMNDPQAMLKAWMGGAGLEQFQKFWEGAASGGKKDSSSR